MFLKQSTFLRPLIFTTVFDQSNDLLISILTTWLSMLHLNRKTFPFFSCILSNVNRSVPTSLSNHKQSLLNALFESALKGLPTGLLSPSLERNF